MTENNFQESIEFLEQLQGEVLERDACSSKISKLKTAKKKLAKNIQAEEKSIEDEINSTVKKQKQALINHYDHELDENRAKKKSVSGKKDKKKSQKMEARFKSETKFLREENEDFEVEIKNLLRKNHVPSFAGTKLYNVMFMPHGAKELGGMLLSFLVYFAVIPAAVMFLFKVFCFDKKPGINMAFYCLLVAAIALILQIIIYIVIYNATRIKHMDVIKETRNIRDKIKANEKQMAAIRTKINKDTDESSYNLKAFDEKLEKLDQEADQIGEEKKEALRQFEDETKLQIEEEIRTRRTPAVDALRQQITETEQDIQALDEEVAARSTSISNQYSQYIAEEFFDADKLADLIALMEDEQAETVSEAIQVYKGTK